MNKLLKPLIFISMLVTVFSCNRYKEVYFVGETQGTYYAVTYYDAEGRFFKTAIDSMLYAFDQSASLWVPTSVISRINDNDTSVRVDAVIEKLYTMSVNISEKTGGYFDFTVGPLVNEWGFGFKQGTDPDVARIDSLNELVDYRKVHLQDGRIIKENPGIKFDFNAIAQGYAVDIIGDFLGKKGVENYIIDIGGEVLAKGKKPGNRSWVVGIEKPNDDLLEGRETQIKVRLSDKAIATSGSYRKFYIKDGIKYSHTIDPYTGYPVTHNLLSASVVADDCATADAYATAMMVMGLPKAMELANGLPGIEALFISDARNGKFDVTYSKGFAELILE